MQPLTKRQREILDYLNEFIQQHGYAPSLEEIGERFSLSSLATVHKHLTNLQDKGFIRRAWNRSRSVELLPSRAGGRAIELPMLGYVAAGQPIEAVAGNETIAVPDSLVSGKRDTYVLRVRGESMIDEQIRDGDWVVVEDRKTADNGEMVIALIGGQDVTLKTLYKEQNRFRLQPANPTMQPIYVEPEALQLEVGAERLARFAGPIGLVGLEAMQGEAVLVRVEGDGADAEFVGAAEDADGDLAPIGGQELAHGSGRL